MADTPKLQPSDRSYEAYEKMNQSIDHANEAKNESSQANTTADEAKQIAESSNTKSVRTQEQLDQVVIDGDSSVEAAQARVDTDGVSHQTLKERLDDEHTDVTTQLADIAKRKTYYLASWDGIVGDGVTDDTEAVQSFFDNYANYENVNIDWSGTYAISSTITIKGNRNMYIAGKLKCLNDMNDALILDTTNSYFSGKINVIGTGGNSYSSRTVKNLVSLETCIQTKFTGFEVQNASRYGVRTLIGGDTNNIYVDYGKVKAWNCGSAGDRTTGTEVAIFDYTDKTDTGSANALSQRSSLTVSGMPGALEVGDIVRIENDFYDVTLVDHTEGTLEVFPWITDTVSTTGTIYSCHGGAIAVNGSNTASSEIGGIDALRCGVGLYANALYGSLVNNLQTQVTGVALVQRNLNYGLTVTGFHPENPENTGGDFLKVDTVESRTNITGMSVLRYQDFRQLAPKDTTGSSKSASYRKLDGVSVFDGLAQRYNQSSDSRNTTGNITTTIGNSPDRNFGFSHRNFALTVNLNWDDDANRLFGYSTCRFIRGGSGSGGASSDPITIGLSSSDADAGHTVMGGSTYEVPATSKVIAIDFLFDYASKDWRVTYSYPTITQAAITKPSGGTTVDAESRTAIDSIIDALKANGITL